MTASPFDQSRYQLRFEWGVEGLRRLAPADVVIVVDVLRFSSTITARVAVGETVRHDASARALSRNGAAVADAAGSGPVVLLGSLTNAAAVAQAVLAEQTRRGARTSVSVVAAGETVGDGAGGSLRFAVEDQLGAGAVLGAIEALGIDHSSPEAAAASESFRGLRAAARHLLTASGSGQELIERGARDEVLAAAQLDAVASVPVLRDGVWVAYGPDLSGA
ncbi:2-phosphosulfolactate phosphatase [Microbacterium sp. 179-B 1A2 NHS]|uniref:2-phosphosulfolactate phosphatase n=1 Tax=Microbacterium sp. 179-B 1A2 NHS TaxID=3142383 RepID=UPI0039A093C6